jgi:hypothetical protein
MATVDTGIPFVRKRWTPTMTPEHLNIVIRPLARDEALAVTAWRLGGELAMYDGAPGQEEALLVMTAGGYGYYAVVQNGEFVGYCCFGPEGRVPGQPAPVDNLLDLGGGLRPDLVGKGLGAVGLPVILCFARSGSPLRDSALRSPRSTDARSCCVVRPGSDRTARFQALADASSPSLF